MLAPNYGSRLSITAKAVHLVHPFMQDSDDADVSIGKCAPVNEMAFVVPIEAINVKVRRDCSPHQFPLGNPAETREQVLDISLGLLIAPLVARVDKDFVQPLTRDRGNAKFCHVQFRRLRAITLSASSMA